MSADNDFTVRELIRSAIIRLVRNAGGEIAPRTLYGPTPASDFTTDPEPEPLAAIRAARQLAWAVGVREYDYVKRARQDGRTWAQIGAALWFPSGEGGVIGAEQAFRHVAPGTGEYDRTFAWRCPSCREIAVDHGPDAGHPADAERGHAEGCERLAAAVREWEDGEEGG